MVNGGGFDWWLVIGTVGGGWWRWCVVGALVVEQVTPGAYTETRRADSFEFLFVLIKVDIKMMKNGI